MFQWQPRPAHPQLRQTGARHRRGGWWLCGWLRSRAIEAVRRKTRWNLCLSCASVNNLAQNPQLSLSKLTEPLESDIIERHYSRWKQEPVKKIITSKQVNIFFHEQNMNSCKNVHKHLMITRFKSKHLSCCNLCLGMYWCLPMLAALLNTLQGKQRIIFTLGNSVSLIICR